jgi:hypothetical protein
VVSGQWSVVTFRRMVNQEDNHGMEPEAMSSSCRHCRPCVGRAMTFHDIVPKQSGGRVQRVSYFRLLMGVAVRYNGAQPERLGGSNVHRTPRFRSTRSSANS